MRRPWLLAVAWPLLMLWNLVCPILLTTSSVVGVVVANKETYDNNEARLRVTVMTDAMVRVPSCQHKFSQIELLNLHSSESILIHSIDTTRETTVLLKSESAANSAGRVGQKWDDPTQIPQQVHVSKLPQGSISLGPGQTAIVPVTFLPRFPDMMEAHDNQNKNGKYYNQRRFHIDDVHPPPRNDGQSPPPVLSRTEHLDLVNMLGWDINAVLFDKAPLIQPDSGNDGGTSSSPSQKRNNLDLSSLPLGHADEFEVSTTVVVETSRGTVNVPISASSVRENPFRVPDMIQFRHPSFSKTRTQTTTLDDEDGFDVDDEEPSASPPSALPSSSSSSRLGPLDTMRHLGGISIHGTLQASEKGRYNRSQATTSASGRSKTSNSSNSPTESDDSTPEDECFDIYLSNPSQNEELQIMEVSISKPELVNIQYDPGRLFFESPTDPDLSASGPAQVIRKWTRDGPLFLPPGVVDAYVLTLCATASGVGDMTSDDELNAFLVWPIDARNTDRDLGVMLIRTDNETLFVALEHSDLSSVGRDADKKEVSESVDEAVISTNDTSRLLQMIPDRLGFEMISTESPDVHSKFGLRNLSPLPIRIMRVIVSVDTKEGRNVQMKELGLDLNIRVDPGFAKGAHLGEEDLGSLLIGPLSSLDDVFSLSCSLDAALSSETSTDRFFFEGTVLLRGTMDTELTFTDWREKMSRNPFRDDHLIAELPFTISIINPRVEAMIDRSTHPYPQLFASQLWDSSARAVAFLFFPMTPFEAVKGMEDSLPTQNYIGSNKISHDLRISSNVAHSIGLKGGKISDSDHNSTDSLCDRFDVTRSSSSSLGDPHPGFDEIGHLSLVYNFEVGNQKGDEAQREFRFPKTENDLDVPKTCYLDILTSPDGAGTFRIPLVVFPGHLELSNSEATAKTASTTKMGFTELLSWSRSSDSTMGKSLTKILSQLMGVRRKSKKNDANVLGLYMRLLSQQKSRPVNSRFHPILLNMGTIDNGKIAKAPLYFTNLNPVPVRVSIDIGEVEGMMVSLSRVEGQSMGDGNSLLDGLPTHTTDALIEDGKFAGHPISGLLEFLSSNEKALAFTSAFNFRDAVDYDSSAIQRYPVLQFLYQWYSEANFHRSALPDELRAKMSTQCAKGRPPPYGPFNISADGRLHGGTPGAFLLSSDRKLFRPLKECRKHDPAVASGAMTVMIPPGARARFEVVLRAPPQTHLESDINHLLATGLILSTNFGDVMPLFVEFETLQGHLFGWPMDPDGELPAIMDVPLQCSWDSKKQLEDSIVSTTLFIPPDDGWMEDFEIGNVVKTGQQTKGVPLFLRSSFSRPVRLLKVESCNPWFKFVPRRSGVKDAFGVNDSVGFVETAAACYDGNGRESSFPSYFQCVLNWLTDRPKLQQDGCGLKPTRDSIFKHTHLEKVKRSVERASLALKTEYNENHDRLVMHLLSQPNPRAAIKSGRKRGDGIVANLELFSVVMNNLRVASEHGVNTLSSSLRATVEYTSTDSRTPQNLSLTIHDLVLRSSLEPPRLFDSDGAWGNMFNFDPTAVGSVAKGFIPLHNPTGVPVRVRFAVSARNTNHSAGKTFPPPFVQNGKMTIGSNGTDHPQWWDGNGGFFTHDIGGDVIMCQHNITIRAGGGAHVTLVNPSLHSQVALLVGCGVRCGLRGDDGQYRGQRHPGATAPIGASSAAGVTLTGLTRHSSAEENAEVGDDPILLSGGTTIPNSGGPSAFAIPYSALDEIVIPPFGTAELGPILFRPPGRHRSLGCDVLKGSAARHWNPLKRELCMNQNFDSVVYLENSLTGLESVVLHGKSRWERLIFLDPPPEAGEETFGDIELRDGKETLVFSGVGRVAQTEGWSFWYWNRVQNLPVLKEVLLHNAGDAEVSISRVYLSSVRGSKTENGLLSCVSGSFRVLTCSEEPFSLEPGESRSVFVEHIPRCKTKKEFVALKVEIQHERQNCPPSIPTAHGAKGRPQTSGVEDPFGKKTFSLSLGYHMEDVLFARCVQVNPDFKREFIQKEDGSSQSYNASRSLLEQSKYFEDQSGVGGLSLLSELLLFFVAAGLICFNMRVRFNAMRGMLQKAPVYLTSGGNKLAVRGKASAKRLRSLWNAAFRCFARVDPSSSELHALSREQMRQVVVGHYKARGATPPAALTGANAFTRDRRATSSAPKRNRLGTGGAATNERIRTLSDAIFQDATVSDSHSLRDCFPVGLGWRTAFTRGVVNEKSAGSISIELMTRKLAQERLWGDEEISKEASEADTFDHEAPSGANDEADDDTSYSPNEFIDDAVRALPTESTKKILTETTIGALEGEAVEAMSVVSTSGSEGAEPKKSSKKLTNHESVDYSILTEKAGIKEPANEGKNSIQKESNIRLNQQAGAGKDNSIRTGNHAIAPKGRSSNNDNEDDGSIKKGDVGKSSKQPFPKPKLQAGKASETVSKPFTSPKKKQQQDQGSQKNQSNERTAQSKASNGEGSKSTPSTTQSKQAVASSKNSSTKATKAKAKGEKLKPKKKQGNTNDAKTTPNEPNDRGTSSPLRPPPGLAPPPGFGSSSSVPLTPFSNARSVIAGTPTRVEDQPTLETMLNSALSNPDVDLNAAAAAFHPQSIGGGAATTTPSTATAVATMAEPGVGGTDLLFRLSESSRATTASSESGGGLFPAGLAGLTGGETAGTADVPQLSLPGILHAEESCENGFDVMDFLDSILNEGSLRPEQDDEDVDEAQPILAVATPTVVSLPSTATLIPPADPKGGPTSLAAVPVLENPWAIDGAHKSRAIMYGISFDEEDKNGDGVSGRGGENDITSSALGPFHLGGGANSARLSTNTSIDGAGLVNIPLLTPAALLSMNADLGRNENGGDGDDDDEEEENVLSFYAGMVDADD